MDAVMSSPGFLAVLEQLKAIALEGLEYAEGPYDKARYAKLLEIACQEYGGAFHIDPVKLRDLFEKQIGIVTPRVAADAVVPDGRGEILVLRRADDGTWCVPGGWMDVGDTPSGAAVREAEEEAGLDVSPDSLIMISNRFGERELYLGHHVSIVTLMKPVSQSNKVTLSHEHTDYAWISDWKEYTWHPGHEEIVEKVLSHMSRTKDFTLKDYPEKLSL